MLEARDPALADMDFVGKRDFLGFFEEIALARNSGLINDDVVHYMFGYYAMMCYDSGPFWTLPMATGFEKKATTGVFSSASRRI